MKNLSTTLKRVFLVGAIIYVAALACTPVDAGDDGTAFALGSGVYGPSHLRDNYSGNTSSDMGLMISLSRLVSLDLRLSTVGTGQTPAAANQSSTPPIPIPKAPGSDLRYSRLGVGLNFRF